MQSRYILAGDIGGTKTILALAGSGREPDKRGIPFLHFRKYESGSYSSLEEVIADFMGELCVKAEETVASFGIAGVVTDGSCVATNIPWTAGEGSIKEQTGLAGVSIVNDFTAVALGIPELGEEDIHSLGNAELDDDGPIAIIGAGTGLGESLAFYSETGKGLRVFQSEGGHASFAPRNEEEINLLRFLMKEYGHVSYERLLSGQGLVNIYNFLVHSSPHEENTSLREEMKNGDGAAVISRCAMEGRDALCAKALDIFLSIYGSEAGNLALKILPTGGLYIAGGIAPKIIEKIKEGPFMKSFLDKGRMSGLLETIPVKVIMNPHVGLIGAAAKGYEMTDRQS